MLRHHLKTGDLASRYECNAALLRTLSEAFRDHHKEYTNLRILAANEDTLLATKSCDALHHFYHVVFFVCFFNIVGVPAAYTVYFHGLHVRLLRVTLNINQSHDRSMP